MDSFFPYIIVERLEYKKANPLYYGAKIRLADFYDQTSQPEKAEAAYKEALEIHPDYWAAYGELGFFYYSHGNFDKAKDALFRAAQISPGNIRALNNLGAVCFKLGNTTQAAAIFERSLASKRNAVAYSNLGVIYYFQGRYMNEEAISFGPGETWPTPIPSRSAPPVFTCFQNISRGPVFPAEPRPLLLAGAAGEQRGRSGKVDVGGYGALE